MGQKRLTVKVSSLEDSLGRFKNIWDRAERGEKFKTPIEILSFENSIMLMKTLSPRRLELLQTLHSIGQISIRQLAKQLDRDYSNVHQDVTALYKMGLVLKSKTNRYYVPWDTIVTEIPLTLDNKAPHRKTTFHKTASAHAHR